MNPFEAPVSPKSRKADPEKGFVVGAKKNSDGSWDYSRAVVPKEDMTQQLETADQTAKEKGKKDRAIPENVKPGTWTMVSIDLRNAILLNQEAISRAQEQNTVDKKAVERMKKLSLEKKLLSNLTHFDLRQEYSLAAILDTLQERIEEYEKSKEEGKTMRYIESDSSRLLHANNDSDDVRNFCNINELLQAAEELYKRLVAENAKNNNTRES